MVLNIFDLSVSEGALGTSGVQPFSMLLMGFIWSDESKSSSRSLYETSLAVSESWGVGIAGVWVSRMIMKEGLCFL